MAVEKFETGKRYRRTHGTREYTVTAVDPDGLHALATYTAAGNDDAIGWVVLEAGDMWSEYVEIVPAPVLVDRFEVGKSYTLAALAPLGKEASAYTVTAVEEDGQIAVATWVSAAGPDSRAVIHIKKTEWVEWVEWVDTPELPAPVETYVALAPGSATPFTLSNRAAATELEGYRIAGYRVFRGTLTCTEEL